MPGARPGPGPFGRAQYRVLNRRNRMIGIEFVGSDGSDGSLAGGVRVAGHWRLRGHVSAIVSRRTAVPGREGPRRVGRQRFSWSRREAADRVADRPLRHWASPVQVVPIPAVSRIGEVVSGPTVTAAWQVGGLVIAGWSIARLGPAVVAIRLVVSRPDGFRLLLGGWPAVARCRPGRST